MTTSALLNLFETYLLLGAIIAVAACTGVVLIYFTIYKWKIKGEKKLSLWKLTLWAAFICYIVIIAGAVNLSRFSGLYSWTDLHPFSSYREAYFRFSATEWRDIILNIIMFMPLGFMLPLLSEKWRRLLRVFAVAAAGTLLIEYLQYAWELGVFQLDDMINNTLGAVIGYGMVMACLTFQGRTRGEAGRRNGLRALGYLTPLFVTVIVFVSIFTVYHMQEFGNLPYANYYFRVNMKDVVLSNSADLSPREAEAPVYSAKVIGREAADAFAREFFAAAPGVSGNAHSADLMEADPDSEGVNYQMSGGGAVLRVDFRGQTWEYLDLSKRGHQEEFGADEWEIRVLLLGFGLEIPENAKFSANKGEGYKFTANMLDDGSGKVVNGTVVCEFFDDGELKSVRNNMIEYEAVRYISLKGVDEAYTEIESGRFNCMKRVPPQRVDVESVRLDHSADTKGFLQPVYRFKAYIDGESRYIWIRAAA
ncbi:MAG: VanZ family protein [Clostridiales Family XIII bacterium]|nr:VanZ family protein [Clostridiales Family XIII bacterium]